MCGIAGMVSPGAAPQTPLVLRMIDLLAHRGPDDEGIYEAGEVCLGHRRLSIIDLSPGGHQPMLDGRNALVFNGEIYNYRALRRELEEAGVEFRSRSDTEVILRGYRFWGLEIVNRLRGMFAFALWDGDKRLLVAARDPFGKKPFYYHQGNGRLVFASEIEAVVAGLDGRPRLDQAGLSHYLLKGYFAPGNSVYEAIHTLRAGHCLEYDPRRGELRQWPFWQGRFELGSNRDDSAAECARIIEAGLRTAVSRRFESDVPVGVLLSGGVDSSLVSLVAAELRSEPVLTFTATFKGTAADEAGYALEVARRAGSIHRELDVPMAAVPSLMPRLVKAYGEPFGDYSAIPTYCLFEALKPFVTVALTGDGGDEIFSGYKDVKLFWWRATLQPLVGIGNLMPKAALARLLYAKRTRVRELGYGLAALRKNGADAFESLLSAGWTRAWRQRFMRPEAWQATGEEAVEREEARRFADAGRTDLERFLNRYLERLTQAFLVKIDRASMAHAVEARSPMLDMDLFEMTRKLPKEVLLDGGEPKALLKEQLAKRMGRAFASRAKMGFTPPLHGWLRQGEAINWVGKLLTDKESLVYSLFAPEQIRRLIARHVGGQNHATRLWHLIFLNAWHSYFYKGSVNFYDDFASIKLSVERQKI